MPLLRELQQPVEKWLASTGAPPPKFPASDFVDEDGHVDVERWISFLAQPPPWLTAADSMRCRASFLEVSDAISKVIRQRQRNVFAQPAVDWLDALVRMWNFDQP